MDMTPIEIDHTALATFECPSFDEAEAVDLDGCIPSSSSLWEIVPDVYQQQQCALELAAPFISGTAADGMLITRAQHESSFQALLQSDLVFLPPLQFGSQDDHEEQQLQEEEEEEALDLSDPRNLCSYRKGKCGQPRTRKLNGRLHTYCAFHRFRSIENQKQFDAKRRKNLASTRRRKSSPRPGNESSKNDSSASTPASSKKPTISASVTEIQGESVGSQVTQEAIEHQRGSASSLRHTKRVTRSAMQATSLSIVL